MKPLSIGLATLFVLVGSASSQMQIDTRNETVYSGSLSDPDPSLEFTSRWAQHDGFNYREYRLTAKSDNSDFSFSMTVPAIMLQSWAEWEETYGKGKTGQEIYKREMSVNVGSYAYRIIPYWNTPNGTKNYWGKLQITEFTSDSVTGTLILNDGKGDDNPDQGFLTASFKAKPQWDVGTPRASYTISESSKIEIAVFFPDGVREETLGNNNIQIFDSNGTEYPIRFDSYDVGSKTATYIATNLIESERYKVALRSNEVAVTNSSRIPFFFEKYQDVLLLQDVETIDKVKQWKDTIDKYAQETLGPRLERLAIIERILKRYKQQTRSIESMPKYVLDKRVNNFGRKEGRIGTSKKHVKVVKAWEKSLSLMSQISDLLDVGTILKKDFSKMTKRQARREIAFLFNETSGALGSISIPANQVDAAIFIVTIPLELTWEPEHKAKKKLREYKQYRRALLNFSKNEIPKLRTEYENRKQNEIDGTKTQFLLLRSQIEGASNLSESQRTEVLQYLNTAALAFETSRLFNVVFRDIFGS